MTKTNIAILIVGIITFLAGIGIRTIFPPSSDPSKEGMKVIRDTTTIYDTIYVDKPIPIYTEKIVTKEIKVPIYLPSDTTTIHDTTYIYLDREIKYYKGEQYEAWVSGYEPNLDKINIFSKTTQVKETIIPKKNFISLSAGVDISTKVGLPISLEYARNIGYFNLLCGFEYDVLLESKTIKFGVEMPIIKW